jgi:glucan phosphoethanolaminetransferase (alkaline phosphatase superfamily)
MPPSTKPQTKKKEAEEGKGKKAVKAVAVVLLLLLVAAFVEAQQNGTQTGGNRTGNPEQVIKNIEEWAVGGAGLMVTLFGAMFWAAVGIIIFHLAVSYIAPSRFQRLSAMWDAVERAKDIAIGLAVVFVIFYGIMAAAAAISGTFTVDKAWDLFVKIVSKPLVDLYNRVFSP